MFTCVFSSCGQVQHEVKQAEKSTCGASKARARCFAGASPSQHIGGLHRARPLASSLSGKHGRRQCKTSVETGCITQIAHSKKPAWVPKTTTLQAGHFRGCRVCKVAISAGHPAVLRRPMRFVRLRCCGCCSFLHEPSLNQLHLTYLAFFTLAVTVCSARKAIVRALTARHV